MTWIKICGTTNLSDAKHALAAGANALGFIFAAGPRRVDPTTAASIIAALPENTGGIGVFIYEAPSVVAEIADNIGLTGIQLHGQEPAEQLAEFRSALGSRMIIKALQAREIIGNRGILDTYLRCTDWFDAVLIDSGGLGQRGGTGARFDWNAAQPVVSRIKEVKSVILAGGLTPENVGRAILLFQPWGLDVVTGVEREPGKKEAAKMHAFVQAVRSTFASSTSQQPAVSGA